MDMVVRVWAPSVLRRDRQLKNNAEYAFPNDEAELERLDMQHAMMTLLMNNKLYWSPIPSDVQRVLDLGTGTGNQHCSGIRRVVDLCY